MKKVLVISYYFPPMGISGSVRVLKFTKYFPRFDWQPFVVTMTPKTYYAKDDKLIDEIRTGDIKIFRTPCHGKKNLLNDHKLKRLPNEHKRRFFKKIKQFYKLPDLQKKWRKKAFNLSSEIVQNEKIDLIFATAPPFIDFIIACDLKKIYNIPLVIDYRDSWLNSATNFLPTPYHRYYFLKKEAEVLRMADEVITVNRRIKEFIIQTHKNLRHKDINIIPHGFDQEDFSAVTQLPRTNKMRLTYAGSFFDLITPKFFLEGVSIAISKRPEIKKRIEACLLGVLSKENIHLLSKLNLTEVVYNPGYVNHKECTKYLLASDVLWFMVGKGKGSEVISTIKLSEYFGARKPILACIPEGVAKSSLRNYDAIKICEPDNPESIANSILEYYDLFAQNKLPIPNEEFVDKYNFEKLTHLLVRYFEFLIDITPQTSLIKTKKISSPV